MGNNERILIGPTPEVATELAAAAVVQVLAGGGPKCVALAGGGTPKRLYQRLTSPPYRNQIAWQSIHWFWGDERTVAPDHPESNYRMVRESLLEPLHVADDHIHRMPADGADLNLAAAQYEETICRFVPPRPDGAPSFDLILLGVGSDGHTASLFPGTRALSEATRLVVPNDVPHLSTRRMTMTFPLLKAARHVLFFVTGADKADIMGHILTSPEASEGGALPAPSASEGSCPAARLRHGLHELTWILDADAARLVSPPPGA